MAAHIEFGDVMAKGAPVDQRTVQHAERITTTSSTTTTYEAKGGEFAAITAAGADIYFTAGASPTALASGAGMRIATDGSTRWIGPMKPGDKVAAIDI